MKIVFVYPDIVQRNPEWRGVYYLGIGSLSAVLKQKGHKVSLLHFTIPIEKNLYLKLLSREITNFTSVVVGFSSTTNMFPFIRKWARWTKENFSALTICGGVHSTLSPEEVINTEGIDMICLGEGEEAMVELCQKLEKKDETNQIQNIWFKKDGKIYKNPPRPLISNLDSLPFPDRTIFDYPNLNLSRDGRSIFMSSRGCPYDCSYCCNRSIRTLYKGKGTYFRFRSPHNVIDEIEKVIKEYSFTKLVHFDDDIFPFKKNWLLEFGKEYKEKIKLPFSCNFRPDLINIEIVKLLKEAGCVEIRMGIESGSDFIRNKILNRQITKQEIINAFSICKKAGMRIYSFNMVGIPHEDSTRVLETVKLNARVKSDYTQVSIFYPYPRTKLFQLCQEKGFMTGNESPSYFNRSILSYDCISNEEIIFFHRHFHLFVKLYRLLYGIPGMVSKLGARILDIIFCSNNLFYSAIKIIIINLYNILSHMKIFKFTKLFTGKKEVQLDREGRLIS